MSQTWYDDVYSGGHTAGLDLQKMEYNFAALRSHFSGSSNPSNAIEGMIFRQLTKNNWRGYNGSSWEGIFNGDASHKIWVYRNDTMTGWVLDATSATDKVLGLRRYDAGSDFNAAGGSNVGSWYVSGLTNANENSHTHPAGAHTHGIPIGWDVSYQLNMGAPGGVSDSNGWIFNVSRLTGGNTYTKSVSDASAGTTGVGSTHTHVISSGDLWRPAAALGTLQYMNLT